MLDSFCMLVRVLGDSVCMWVSVVCIVQCVVCRSGCMLVVFGGIVVLCGRMRSTGSIV